MLTEEQSKFAEEHIKIAYLLANKWIKRLPNVEIDEIKSLCLLGLVKSAKYYDPNKGFRFSTLASRIIDNEILMMLRKEKKHHHVLSLYLPVTHNKSEKEEIYIIDTVEVIDDPHDTAYINYILSEVEKLPEREKIVLQDTLSNYRNREIGAKLGISQSYISRINTRAINRLRKRLGVQNDI